jgi:hypothetical protein
MALVETRQLLEPAEGGGESYSQIYRRKSFRRLAFGFAFAGKRSMSLCDSFTPAIWRCPGWRL